MQQIGISWHWPIFLIHNGFQCIAAGTQSCHCITDISCHVLSTTIWVGEAGGQIQDTLVQSMILMSASLFGNVPPDTERALSRQETLVRKFFDLLIDSCETRRNVSYYADRLCITPKYLTTVVKSVSNRPAQNWINDAVLVRAKRYIITTDLTINQIADRLHFHTASSFVRFFRVHAGLSPLEYRKRMNQDL